MNDYSRALFASLTLVLGSAASATDVSRTQKLVADATLGVTELNAGQFDKVEGRFDATMASALPLEKLRSTWAGITGQVGKLKHCGTATTSEKDGFLVVVVPCDFDNAALNAQFAYDADDKIGGLYFKPRQPGG